MARSVAVCLLALACSACSITDEAEEQHSWGCFVCINVGASVEAGEGKVQGRGVDQDVDRGGQADASGGEVDVGVGTPGALPRVPQVGQEGVEDRRRSRPSGP